MDSSPRTMTLNKEPEECGPNFPHTSDNVIDGYKVSEQISSTLSYFGIEGLLIGSSLWNPINLITNGHPKYIGRKKKVSWLSRVRVVLIPSRTEYESAKLADALWWTGDDFSDFKESAVDELNVTMQRLKLDRKTAIKTLYQPEFHASALTPPTDEDAATAKHAKYMENLAKFNDLVLRDEIKTNCAVSTLSRRVGIRRA